MAPLHGKLVLYYGELNQRAGSSDPTHVYDAWTWDGTSWAPMAAPSPSIFQPVMAGLDNELVVFGPKPNTVCVTETWDGAAWTLHGGASPGDVAPTRSWGAMTSINGKVVLFGGVGVEPNSLTDVDLSDTWEWDGTAWTQRMVMGPSAREFASMASW
jgi:hypothetical protein